MGWDADGEYDGICVCGKAEMDGIACRYGATHQTLEMARAAERLRNPHLYPSGETTNAIPPQKPQPMPWETPLFPAPVAAPSFPWTAQSTPTTGTDTNIFPWSGKTQI